MITLLIIAWVKGKKVKSNMKKRDKLKWILCNGQVKNNNVIKVAFFVNRLIFNWNSTTQLHKQAQFIFGQFW